MSISFSRYISFFVIEFILVFMTSCFVKHHRWTEQEKKDFECNCSKTDTFDNIVIFFKGFENNEFDSVLINEYRDNTLLDSFKIFVSPSRNPWEMEHKRRSGTIRRTMNIKYKYQFIISGQTPHELTNMKMVMWDQWTENSEGYGCVMGDYTLDGLKFEHVGNPEIIKR